MNLITNNSFIRFLLVGIVNTLVGYSIFLMLSFTGLSYPLLILFSTILGVVFNFKTVSKFVFMTSNSKLIISFFSVYVIIYLLNILGIKIFLSFGVNLLFSQALLVLPLACISYVLNKMFVFKVRKQ
jgi:putative flippase GtrA